MLIKTEHLEVTLTQVSIGNRNLATKLTQVLMVTEIQQ